MKKKNLRIFLDVLSFVEFVFVFLGAYYLFVEVLGWSSFVTVIIIFGLVFVRLGLNMIIKDELK